MFSDRPDTLGAIPANRLPSISDVESAIDAGKSFDIQPNGEMRERPAEEMKLVEASRDDILNRLRDSIAESEALAAEALSMKATLLVNFGEDGRILKGLIDSRYHGTKALVIVLERLIKDAKEKP